MPAPQASKLGAVKGTAVTTPDSKLVASFTELGRRKVFRAGVGYAIAAFAVLQTLSSVSGAIDLAPGTFRLIIIGILCGALIGVLGSATSVWSHLRRI